MENLIPSLASLITPDISGRLARLFKVEEATVSNAVKILSALALAALAKKAATPEGAAAALGSLPQKDEPGLLASLVAAFKGDVPSETPADRMQALFGGGINSMISSLSRKLGFDLGPLAGMLTPLIGQQLAKTAKAQALDAAGFAKLLQNGTTGFLAATENAEIAGIVRETLAVGEQAEAVRAAFTAEELEDIHAAPMAAYAIIARASISGIRSSVAELKAAHQAGLELLKQVEPTSLLGTVFGAGLTSSEEAELRKEIASGDPLTEMLRRGLAAVKAKAPGEAEAFRSLVLEVAQKVAAAGKEGGFLGFGGIQVSDAEKAALAQIEAALA